jgi:hypothetical protein
MRLVTGHRSRLWPAIVAAAIVAPIGAPAHVSAQGVGGPVVSDSRVGYIDGAIPGTQFRVRFDTAYNNRRPSRAEFFYAQTAPRGPGLPVPEPSVDYQDLSAYAEVAVWPRLSGFLEVPTRFLNPDVNANATGLADMNAGFKYALLQGESGVLTAQFRAYAPTGEADRGLGTRHVSLEPALLYFLPLTDQARVEGELRYWVPVGGTDFAGDVIRYGVGVNCDVFTNCTLRVTPVAELVGWTVLGGKESSVLPSGLTAVQSAAGDTIVNAKLGVRVGLFDQIDLYGGWGRPLTGDRWYENVFRLEMRVIY